jgi:tRNA threonylcarbamoyl adenosine modification protein YeaZ
VTLAHAHAAEDKGLAARLPVLVMDVLSAGGGGPDLVAVVVGPGSFTGLRAGISVATGLGLGMGIQVHGVTVAEALAARLPPLEGRTLWVATHARRGRVFLDTGDGARGYQTDALPGAIGRIAVAGNAANVVAGALAAKGADVMLTAARAPLVEDVAAIGVRRHAGELSALAPLPLYVDAPEAKLPAGGLRAAPQ